MRRSSREISDSLQSQSGGFQLCNRQQTTENRCRKTAPESSEKIEIPKLQLSQEEMRSVIRRTTLEKTFEERDTPNQAVVRVVNGTARAWSIQYQIREIISPPRPSRQWRRGKRQECGRVEQQSSAQDPRAHSKPKQKQSLRCHEQGVVQQSEDPIE